MSSLPWQGGTSDRAFSHGRDFLKRGGVAQPPSPPCQLTWKCTDPSRKAPLSSWSVGLFAQTHVGGRGSLFKALLILHGRSFPIQSEAAMVALKDQGLGA